jgi:UDP-N-acetylglucosamine 4,6-dehydratase
MDGTLIFGGTGSLGRKLIERMLPDGHRVSVYSRDEAKHWTIANQLANHPQRSQLKFYVGDIRDAARVQDVIRRDKPKSIIIAAALKQVDTCELSPGESVLTNLVGTQHVIDAVNSCLHPPTTVLFVSTDKACAPVNVYGMCKAISERIVTSQASTGNPAVCYLAVRYGNVLESRGSIVPLFKHQGIHGSFLTVTDPNMTRFLMTLDDSVDLIKHAIRHGKPGETWIPRLPAMKIGHLADIFSKRYVKPVKVIGLRPGEKKDEDLINESESARARQEGTKHFIIGPAFSAGSGPPFVYSSKQNVMTRDELETYLDGLGILDAPLDSFKGVSVEEIMTNRKE